MLELYLEEPKKLAIRQVEYSPPVKDDEVKIKLIYGGICGTDLSVYKGNLPYATYPIKPGHELVGTIIDKGSNVSYNIGTRVIVNPNDFCDTCNMCLKGKTNLCLHKKSLGINEHGGFAEEFIIASKNILPIPDSLSNEKAVLIEPLSVVIHALNKVEIKKDTSIAVVGCGNEGMLSIAVATKLGAEVTAIDIKQEKLDFVEKNWGVKAFHVNEIKGKFDIVIEAAGTKHSVELAAQLVNRGGAIVLIGITPEATLPISELVRNEISIHGSIIYHFPNDFLQAADMLVDDKFSVDPIVSEIIPLNQYEKAYGKALSGNYNKIILDFKNK